MSEEVRVSITYGDGISVSRDEYGLPAVKVQSRVFEPALVSLHLGRAGIAIVSL